MLTKTELRKAVRQLKKQHTQEELKALSTVITGKLLELPCIKEATTVMLYCSLPDEVYTMDMIHRLHGEGKKIVVKQINKPESVRIEVIDDGAGISKEKLPMIFDRYYRDERHKRDKIGTGLGLSIVQGILKQHKFPFGVMSEEGKGSTFWFEIVL